MSFFSRFSPLRAYRDLRDFLVTRQRHELGFMAAALLITMTIIGMFVYDSAPRVPPPEPEIIYAESWSLNRTDAQIAAAAKRNEKRKAERNAELEKRRAKSRAEFQQLDNKLDSWGF